MSETVPLPSLEHRQVLDDNLLDWMWDFTEKLYVTLGIEPYICDQEMFRYAYLRDFQFTIARAFNSFLHDLYPTDEGLTDDEVLSARLIHYHPIWEDISHEYYEGVNANRYLEEPFTAEYEDVGKDIDEKVEPEDAQEIVELDILDYDPDTDINPGCRVLSDEEIKITAGGINEEIASLFEDVFPTANKDTELVNSIVLYIFLFLASIVGRKKLNVTMRAYFEELAVNRHWIL